MKVIKQSTLTAPKVSLILLDWSVRESFHLLHYLKQQSVPRESFEVIVIEYYQKVGKALEAFIDEVDTLILLEMPEQNYYHKHLMYNVGIVVARGEIVVICDSDAMVKPTFIESIIKAFQEQPNAVIHLDQFRNNNREFYPFNYPSFAEVEGPGCANYQAGVTTGLASTTQPLHNRNYGACFCAKRQDLIAIGGSDEHVDYVGYICGPYDLTFRLTAAGKQEHWLDTEFLYHTWHPGQAGTDNYLGPHDGRHFSSTTLEGIGIHRIRPHVLNPALSMLQEDPNTSLEILLAKVIHPINYEITRREFLESDAVHQHAKETYHTLNYHGYVIEKVDQYYQATPFIDYSHGKAQSGLISDSLTSLEHTIARNLPKRYRLAQFVNRLLIHPNSFLEILKQKREQAKRQAAAPSVNPTVTTKVKKQPLSQKLQRQKYLLHQFLLDCHTASQSLDRIISNLLTLQQRKQKPIDVCVFSRREYLILKFLKRMQLLPRFKLHRIKSSDSALRYCKHRSQHKLAKIIISRECYINFRKQFKNHWRVEMVVV